MNSITIDIINEKAIYLLKDLELLKMIRLRRDKNSIDNTDWQKYKGSMSKQSINDIDDQLNQLRSEWE